MTTESTGAHRSSRPTGWPGARPAPRSGPAQAGQSSCAAFAARSGMQSRFTADDPGCPKKNTWRNDCLHASDNLPSLPTSLPTSHQSSNRGRASALHGRRRDPRHVQRRRPGTASQPHLAGGRVHGQEADAREHRKAACARASSHHRPALLHCPLDAGCIHTKRVATCMQGASKKEAWQSRRAAEITRPVTRTACEAARRKARECGRSAHRS